jgi:tetratricopeptide (TPR) repeat protein
MKLPTAALVLILAFAAAAGDTTDPESALAAADDVFNQRRYEEAEAAYHQALKLAMQADDSSTQVEALAQLARCRLIADDHDQTTALLSRAAELASERDSLGWSRYLGVRGR